MSLCPTVPPAAAAGAGPSAPGERRVAQGREALAGGGPRRRVRGPHLLEEVREARPPAPRGVRVRLGAGGRAAAGHELPDDEGGAVNVHLLGVRRGGAGGVRPAELRGGVAGRAGSRRVGPSEIDAAAAAAVRGGRALAARERLGRAEVDELEAAKAAGEEEVSRLEVPVHYDGVAVVKEMEGVEELNRPAVHLILRQTKLISKLPKRNRSTPL